MTFNRWAIIIEHSGNLRLILTDFCSICNGNWVENANPILYIFLWLYFAKRIRSNADFFQGKRAARTVPQTEWSSVHLPCRRAVRINACRLLSMHSSLPDADNVSAHRQVLLLQETQCGCTPCRAAKPS